jgi:hypothetical protein
VQEVLKDTASRIMVFLTDVFGAPKTGIVAVDLITRLYSSRALAQHQVLFADLSWGEVDAVNQAGWYLLTITNTAHLADLGYTILSITPAVPGTFAPFHEEIQVVMRYKEEVWRRQLGLNKQNQHLIATGWNAQGFMTTGKLRIYDDNTMLSMITEYDVAVSYSPVTGEILENIITEA